MLISAVDGSFPYKFAEPHCNCFGPVGNLKLSQYMLDMLLDGAFGDDEFACDRTVGVSFGHQCENFVFAPGVKGTVLEGAVRFGCGRG